MSVTVLAIDDSVSIRELINFVLTKAGFEVVLAEDGVEGIEKLETISPDVIITDINMPRLNGFGVIEKVRAHEKHRGLPVLVLTTEISPEKKAKAREAGATGWIVKPFSPSQLVESINRVAPTSSASSAA